MSSRFVVSPTAATSRGSHGRMSLPDIVVSRDFAFNAAENEKDRGGAAAAAGVVKPLSSSLVAHSPPSVTSQSSPNAHRTLISSTSPGGGGGSSHPSSSLGSSRKPPSTAELETRESKTRGASSPSSSTKERKHRHKRRGEEARNGKGPEASGTLKKVDPELGADGAQEAHGASGGAAMDSSRKRGEQDDNNPPNLSSLSGGGGGAPSLASSVSLMATFTEQEQKYFRKMFDMFDTDHSGAIGYFEMKNLTKHLGVQLSDDALRRSIASVDSNGNGELEYEEFLQWLANVNENSDGDGDAFAILKSKIRAQGARPLTTSQIEQFKEVFRHFDADGSGTIDVEELGHVFEAMGQQLSSEELQAVLRQADDDGSGEIDFDEFLMLMCCSFGAEKSFEADLMDAFRRYDIDNDGLITTRDLRQLVQELVGSTMTASEIDDVVEVASMERADGYIEFLKWESLWDACRGVM